MADRLAGGDLDSTLRQMKANGDSFNTIAKRLYADYGVDVTGQTVANWLKALAKQPTKAAS